MPRRQVTTLELHLVPIHCWGNRGMGCRKNRPTIFTPPGNRTWDFSVVSLVRYPLLHGAPLTTLDVHLLGLQNMVTWSGTYAACGTEEVKLLSYQHLMRLHLPATIAGLAYSDVEGTVPPKIG